MRIPSVREDFRPADAIGIHLTSLDDPNRYHPSIDIWTSSALTWAHMDPSLQKVAKGPPPHSATQTRSERKIARS